MPDLRLPEFYIIGAPKCGTTALYTYLNDHPSVFMPTIKEPHFFSTDFKDYGNVTDLESYLALFEDAPKSALRGEASVWYLYSEKAVANIIAARPDAKFFVLLRNPIDAVEAMHAQLLVNFMEDIPDLEDAWRAQEDRRLGKRIPLLCTAPQHVLYGEVFSYAHQLKRLLHLVPKEQVKILIYEELFASPEKVFSDIQSFLNLEIISRKVFERINPSRAPQNLWMHHIIARPPFPLNLIAKAMRRVSRKYGLHLGAPFLKAALKLARVQKATRRPMRPEFRQQLSSFFSRDIKEVEEILSRPLDTLWPSA